MGASPGAVPQIYAIGWEAATLIVHPENPLPSLDEKWVKYLFWVHGCNLAARVNLWSELPGLETWSKNPIGKILPRFDSSDGQAVREILLGKDCGLDEEAYQVAEEAVRERIVAA